MSLCCVLSLPFRLLFYCRRFDDVSKTIQWKIAESFELSEAALFSILRTGLLCKNCSVAISDAVLYIFSSGNFLAWQLSVCFIRVRYEASCPGVNVKLLWQVVLIFEHTPTGLSLHIFGSRRCPN